MVWACRFTSTRTFPTVGVKRILFNRDYQAAWNRLAIKGAAAVLADNVETLTQLLGPVKSSTLVKAVKGAAGQETASEEAEAFWALLGGRLRAAATVFTTRNEWSKPEDSHLLQSADEGNAIGD